MDVKTVVASLLLGVSIQFAVAAPGPQTAGKLLGPAVKVYPGDASYPTAQDWATLNRTINGHLTQSRLTWTGKYETSLIANCTNRNAYGPIYESDPVSLGTPWWAGYHCDNCPAKYAQTTCSLGNLPNYVVDARTAQDVAAGVEFANRFNLRLVVKNTGHDFMGRNLGFGSLSIWTHNLKSPIKLNSNWIPTGGTSTAAPISAITFGSGFQWSDIFLWAYNNARIITGGTDGTVGVSGWLLSGGHGSFTNHFGLGSDNVLEYEVVTPTGQIVTANEVSYPDLFWALRGGGPGLGVVTKITMKAHNSTSLNAIRLTIRPNIDVRTPEGQITWAKAMTYLLSSFPEFVDFGLSGHPIMLNYQFNTLLTAPGKSADDINAFATPYVTKLQDRYGVSVTMSAIDSSTLAFLMAYSLTPNAGIPNKKPQGPAIMASRLISREALNNTKLLESTLAYLFEHDYVCEPFVVGGGAVADTSIDTALNPAWRDAIIHFSILPNNQGDIKTVGEVRKGYITLADALKVLNDFSVTSGAYLNEAMWSETDWKTTFWGSNYNRLLEIKQTYDPNNTMWCFPCVGGDQFSEGPDGKLYEYSPSLE